MIFLLVEIHLSLQAGMDGKAARFWRMLHQDLFLSSPDSDTTAPDASFLPPASHGLPDIIKLIICVPVRATSETNIH